MTGSDWLWLGFTVVLAVFALWRRVHWLRWGA